VFLYTQSLFIKKLVKSKILVYNIWWFTIEIKINKAQQYEMYEVMKKNEYRCKTTTV
jgi:hypothetical protein